MDVRRSRSLRGYASAVQTLGLLLGGLAMASGRWVTGALLILLAAVATAVRTQLPAVEVPDPQLSTESVAALRAERDGRSEVSAVKTLRTLYPELSLVQAVRLVRAI